MVDVKETVAHYNDAFATALMVFIEDSVIGLLVFIFWIFILMQALRPLRVTRGGTQKDNSLMIMAVAISLALLCTIMTMGIYLDIKFSLCGAFRCSILKSLLGA